MKQISATGETSKAHGSLDYSKFNSIDFEKDYGIDSDNESKDNLKSKIPDLRGTPLEGIDPLRVLCGDMTAEERSTAFQKAMLELEKKGGLKPPPPPPPPECNPMVGYVPKCDVDSTPHNWLEPESTWTGFAPDEYNDGSFSQQVYHGDCGNEFSDGSDSITTEPHNGLPNKSGGELLGDVPSESPSPQDKEETDMQGNMALFTTTKALDSADTCLNKAVNDDMWQVLGDDTDEDVAQDARMVDEAQIPHESKNQASPLSFKTPMATDTGPLEDEKGVEWNPDREVRGERNCPPGSDTGTQALGIENTSSAKPPQDVDNERRRIAAAYEAGQQKINSQARVLEGVDTDGWNLEKSQFDLVEEADEDLTELNVLLDCCENESNKERLRLAISEFEIKLRVKRTWAWFPLTQYTWSGYEYEKPIVTLDFKVAGAGKLPVEDIHCEFGTDWFDLKVWNVVWPDDPDIKYHHRVKKTRLMRDIVPSQCSIKAKGNHIYVYLQKVNEIRHGYCAWPDLCAGKGRKPFKYREDAPDGGLMDFFEAEYEKHEGYDGFRRDIGKAMEKIHRCEPIRGIPDTPMDED